VLESTWFLGFSATRKHSRGFGAVVPPLTSQVQKSLLAPPSQRSVELQEWMSFRGTPSESAALQFLFDRYRVPLIRYVFRRTGDAQYTEDVVSDTMLKAVHARTTLEWRGVPLRGWLLRIATNLTRSSSRMRREERPSSEPVAPAGAAIHEHEDLRAAIAGLPVELAEAIALHHLQELPVEEVAKVMGVPCGTVKSWLARGRALLRDRLFRAAEREMRR